jgi:hypothetical protein
VTAARKILVLLAMLLGAMSTAGAQGKGDFAKKSTKDMLASVAAEHPASYYVLAKRLFEEGQKDEAVFWFYTGQIRYRARLMTHPNLPKDGEPALFGSLSEVVGRPLNQYAFGDIPKLASIIDRALAWDAQHADPFAPKGEVRDTVRAGLEKMKADVLANADEIRATRIKNGLENRSR